MFRWVHISCGDTHLVKCFSPSDLAIKEGDACVVELDKIPEFGHVATISEVSGTPDASVKDFPVVLRRATLQDQAHINENEVITKTSISL